MKNILVALTIALFANVAQAADVVTLRVDGLVCAFCGAAIEKKLKANSATADVLVSLEDKIVAVSFKEGKQIDDATLKTLINDAGYTIKDITRGSGSIEEIRAKLKPKKGS